MVYRRFCFALGKVILLLTTVVLVDQDAELDQLRQTGQLQEKKATGQAEKLAEELKGDYFVVGVIAGVISLVDRSL